MLSAKASYEMLESYKIPMPRWGYATTTEEAMIVAGNMDYPIVAKIDSRHIVHKTDAGGVEFVYKEDDFLEAYEKITRRFSEIKIDGIIIQEMITGKEAIIGAKIDEQFGPVIMFGTGGTLTEVVKDIQFRIIPIKEEDAADMIDQTKISKLLNFRGSSINKQKIIDILLKVSKLMELEPIKEMDMNPVFLNSKGAFAADVRIVVNS